MKRSQERREAIKRIFDFWQSKGIVVHKRLTEDMEARVDACLRKYEEGEIMMAIDVYATVLSGEEYWWSYKWNLTDFMMRGVERFHEQTPDNYKRRRTIDAPQAVILERK